MLGDDIFRVGHDLIIAGVVVKVYGLAKGADMSKLEVAARGFLYCAGFALFLAAVLGQPSCEDAGDGMFGGCEVEADDGYEPSWEERAGTALYWFILLYTPVAMGAAQDRRMRPFGDD